MPRVHAALLAALVGIAVSCSPDRSAPTASTARPRGDILIADTTGDTTLLAPSTDTTSADTTYSLLYCPRPAASGSAIIGPNGGRVSAAGWELVIPAGALADSELVTLVRPAGDFSRIEAEVGDQEHWQFLAPVQFTVNLTKCPAVPDSLLALWVDNSTGTVLGAVHGSSDQTAHTFKFLTDHLSGYVIAY